MFNLQGSELVIILLLALVVLGPEKLPEAMRKLGQFYGELRRMAGGFQEEFQRAVDEPAQEVRKTADLIRDSADFTALSEGERSEKPKSAEMASPTTEEAAKDSDGATAATDDVELPQHGTEPTEKTEKTGDTGDTHVSAAPVNEIAFANSSAGLEQRRRRKQEAAAARERAEQLAAEAAAAAEAAEAADAELGAKVAPTTGADDREDDATPGEDGGDARVS